MRLDDVAAFIKASVAVLFGVQLGDDEAQLLAMAIVAMSLLITLGLIARSVVLWIRRRLGDDEAISDDQAAMVRLIKNDLQSVRQSIDKFSEKLGSTIGTQLDDLAETIKSTAPPSTNDNQADPEEKKGVRLFYAERVRDAVVHKFMAGNWFTEIDGLRHVFEFRSVSLAGLSIGIMLETPYRRPASENTQDDYRLEVSADGRRVLEFMWDYEGAAGPRVVYLARDRKWVEDIAAWNFPEPLVAPVEALEAAE